MRAGLDGLGERVGSAVDGYRIGMVGDGSPHWVSGFLAGAQGAILSFLVVVLPTMTAYVATSADPTNAEVGWPRSVAVGAALWLLGHGGVLRAGGSEVTLVPLGLTALALFAAYASARRTARPTRSAWLASLGGYLSVVGVALVLAAGSGPLGADALAVLRLLVGAVLVAGIGGGAALLGPAELARLTEPVWARLPRWSRLAARAGVMVAASLVVLASALTLVWFVLGRAATDDVVSALSLDPVGGVILGFAQLAVLPNLVLWAVAWLVGPGFAVGQGTVFAPAQVVGGPMPAMPILGALPISAGGPLLAAPLLLVLLGAAGGWWWHRRRDASGVWQPFAAAAVLAACAGGLVGLFALVSGGAAGPGRLAVVGAPVLELALVAGLLVLVGAAVVVVPAEAAVRAALSRGLRGIAGRLRGSGQPPEPGESNDDQPGSPDINAF